MLHIRNLSPVDIVVAPPEQIQESIPPSSSQGSNQNTSVRRSLFDKNLDKDLISSPVRYSSTPMVTIQGRKSRFFNESNLCPSPIAKNSQKNRTVQDIRISDENGKHHQVHVADFEQKAIERYDIPTTPVSRRSSTHSRNSKTPTKTTTQKSSHQMKKCSVIMESMEFDSETVTNYRRHQMSRLSVDSNVTDRNSVAMQETRINHQNRQNQNNPEVDEYKELKKKLAKIHGDGYDMTDDNSDVDDNIIVNVIGNGKSRVIDNDSNIDIPETQEQTVYEIPPTQTDEIEVEEEQYESPQNQQDNHHTIDIELPETQQNAISQRNREDSINRVVSNEGFESIRQLARLTTNGNMTEQSIASVLSTTGKQNATNNQASRTETQSYLKLTKAKGNIRKKKPKKGENRKRALYDNNSDEYPDVIEEQISKEIEQTKSSSGVESEQSSANSELRVTRNRTAQNSQTSHESQINENPDDVFVRPAPLEKRNKSKKVQKTLQNEVEQQHVNEIETESNTRSSKRNKQVIDDEIVQHEITENVETETQITRASKRITAKRVADENAPPSDVPSRKRKKKNTENTKRKENIPVENSSNEDDEGFNSENERAKSVENEDADDVIYEPHNDRYGFRVRRLMKPYWVFSEFTQAQTYGFCYDTKNLAKKKDLKTATRFVEPTNRYASTNIFGYDRVKPRTQSKHSKTKSYRRIRKPSSTISDKSRSKSPQIGRNQVAEIQTNQPQVQIQITEKHSMSMQTSLTLENFNENRSQASDVFAPIEKLDLLNAGESLEGNSLSVSNMNFDISNIDKIVFDECGYGLYFGMFSDNTSDGVIKVTPGGYKKLNRSKTSEIVS